MRPLLLLLSLLCLPFPLLAEPLEIRVGGYVFPPYVQVDEQGQWHGLTLDVLAALNARQSDYRFVFFPTSATRRYHDFAHHQYDLMLFESPQWGWQRFGVVGHPGPVTGRELFVAQRQPGRDQDYFADLADKRIAVFSGYHYAFADYNPDRVYLRAEHNAIITFAHESNIQLVLRGRAELGVVSEAFLQDYLATYPQYRSQLLIADQADQLYEYWFVLRRDAPPGLPVLAELVGELEHEGVLQGLLQRYQLPRQRF
ncbi:MAG: substrate-binding periplasmic protein [Pseudomonas sp.]